VQVRPPSLEAATPVRPDGCRGVHFRLNGGPQRPCMSSQAATSRVPSSLTASALPTLPYWPSWGPLTSTFGPTTGGRPAAASATADSAEASTADASFDLRPGRSRIVVIP